MSERLDDATVRALVKRFGAPFAVEVSELLVTYQSGVMMRHDAAKVRELLATFDALAREVLARRGQRCGTCRHWDRLDMTHSARGYCDVEAKREPVRHDWHCADWQATEAGR